MKITIINSKGYWKNGWISSEKDLQVFIAALARNDLEVEAFEVAELAELEQLISKLDTKSLVWPNAYYVNKTKDGDDKIWLAEVLESHQLAVIGSGKKTLQSVLRKDICQERLQQAGLPIPEFAIVRAHELADIKQILDSSSLSYPAVVKLTAESGSMGMTKDSLVQTQEDAILQIRQMIQRFEQDVIIEDFLPSDDITMAYFQNPAGTPQMLCTYYKVDDKPGNQHIMGQKERFMEWGGPKQMPVVEEAAILEQMAELVPKICETLQIRDLTRVDGRLDHNGKLRVFDVNGFPALSFPESVQVKQAIQCFPTYEPMAVYEALLNTIVWNAAKRYQLEVPERVAKHNLFRLEGIQQMPQSKTDKLNTSMF
ncbi:MAG: hypothetical protein MRY78_05240 [Saprospiraceae bacterium]|nr:hypothetical protein [Saprospiraceae bacterium]